MIIKSFQWQIHIVTRKNKILRLPYIILYAINMDQYQIDCIPTILRKSGSKYYIYIKHGSFKRVTHFKYLEHLIIQDNDLKMEVSARIQKGNKSFFGLGKVLSLRTLSTNLMIQMYMTLIRPIVL
jgi:hypothetical protein